jgi:hypothetical protein
MAGEELVAKYQTLIFLAGSASAEFFADMALSPFEAVKVRVLCCCGGSAVACRAFFYKNNLSIDNSLFSYKKCLQCVGDRIVLLTLLLAYCCHLLYSLHEPSAALCANPNCSSACFSGHFNYLMTHARVFACVYCPSAPMCAGCCADAPRLCQGPVRRHAQADQG